MAVVIINVYTTLILFGNDNIKDIWGIMSIDVLTLILYAKHLIIIYIITAIAIVIK